MMPEPDKFDKLAKEVWVKGPSPERISHAFRQVDLEARIEELESVCYTLQFSLSKNNREVIRKFIDELRAKLEELKKEGR